MLIFGKTKKTVATKPELADTFLSNLNNRMADKDDKHEENIKGIFYVDTQCIDCDLCRETAPANFTRQEDEGYSYVFKQPESDEEREQCEEAMEGCPVEAIGDDGE